MSPLTQGRKSETLRSTNKSSLASSCATLSFGGWLSRAVLINDAQIAVVVCFLLFFFFSSLVFP